jgi:hypothetical protein
MGYRNKEKQKISMKRYRDSHKEQIHKYQKKYRNEHKEARKEYHKKYRKKNLSLLTEKKKEYYLKNRSDIISKKRIYNKEHTKERREKTIIKNFGINNEQYNNLLYKQNNLCAICLNPEKGIDPRTNRNFNLAIDHDHIDGGIRGLLCSKCNRGLGSFKDNINLLKRAIGYLEDYKIN